MRVPAPGAGAPIPTQGQSFGGGTGGPGGPGEDEYEEGDNRRLWLIAGAILVLGLIIGIIIAVAASGSDDDSTTTTTSSSSSSTSTSTTTTLPVTTTAPPTTAPAAPSITQFTVGQNPVSCPNTDQVTLSWVTQNTSGVTVSIDNPNNAFGNYGPTATEPFPFECGNGPGPVQHTYYLRATGAGGQTTQKQLTVTGNFSQSSTTSTT